MLNKVIQIVTKRLLDREMMTIDIAQDELQFEEKPLLQAKTVRITGVDAVFIEKLVSGERDALFHQWFQLASSYGNKIELILFDSGEPWLQYKDIAAIPFAIFSNSGERLAHVSRNVICYHDIALLPSSSLLCKERDQLVTPLAKESLIQKQIEIWERL